MTVKYESAVNMYVENAVLHGEATDNGNPQLANLAYDKKVEALKIIRSADDKGMSALSELLTHDSPYVRCSAATHVLPLDQHAAITVLEELTSAPPFVCTDARMVLREWKAGRLTVP